MALTSPIEGNIVKRWRKSVFQTYVRGNEYGPDIGKGPNAIHQRRDDLSKNRGDTITQSLIAEIGGNGVTGSGTLEGNEEALPNYDHKIMVEQRRQAVLVSDADQQKTEIQLLNEARPQLMNWILNKTRNDINDAMGSMPATGTTFPNFNGTPYASAAAAVRNAWHVANADGAGPRVLYGDAISNRAAGDHAASLANITAGMTLTYDLVLKMKRMALKSNPRIRPAMVKNKDGAIVEVFKLYVGSEAFRDLTADMKQNNIEAGNRGKSNPLYRDGDQFCRDVIVREIPSIDTLGAVGSGGAEVAPCYFCGAQATGIAYAKMPTPIGETRDYGDKKGRGIKEYVGFSKSRFNGLDHGILTAYVAAAGEA